MNQSFFYSWFLPMLPIALLWLVGAIVALVTWRRHPQVSLLALLGCLVLLFTSVAFPIAQFWLINQQLSRGSSSAQMGGWLSLLGLARTSSAMLGYVLLLCAVFVGRGWRGQPYAPPPVDISLRTAPREPRPEDRYPPDSDDIQEGQRRS